MQIADVRTTPRSALACSRLLALAVILCAAVAACGRVRRPELSPASRVTVVDLTPRFVAFYDSATARPLTADERWILWKRLDGFAAVPPTPFGDTLARTLLDSAWARYPSAMPRIRRGATALPASPDSLLGLVTSTLGCGADTRIRLVTFVGGFEDNAFAFASADGTPSIAVPVEGGDAVRSMIHEFTHAVHRSRGCANLPADYDQTLAELVITEGLAMRMVEHLSPGRAPTYSIIASPAWLDSSRSREAAILTGIGQHLDERGLAQRFTFGRGTAGVSREAYFAGWVVVGALLDSGVSFHTIATTPIERLSAMAEVGIRRALNHQ